MNFSEWLITESKQELVKLGIPEVVASIFYEQFGKNGTLIGKWFAEYYGYSGDNWFRNKFSNFNRIDIWDFARIYETEVDTKEYRKLLKDLEIENWHPIDKTSIKKEIKKSLLEDVFFKAYTIVQDIASGQLSDVAAYKKLKFLKAQEKYDKKNIFKNQTPIKTYDNGWRWIDVGKKCHLLGKQMKNCGAASWMSKDDAQATILALFDKGNKPHVLITYSPNQNRLAHEQGIASTAIKDKYIPYVMDLANAIGAYFDPYTSKSPSMQLQYMLGRKGFKIEQLWKDSFTSGHGFRLIAPDGKEYFTNSFDVISKSDVDELLKDPDMAQNYWWNNRLRGDNRVKNVFQVHLKSTAEHKGAQYMPIGMFAQRY